MISTIFYLTSDSELNFDINSTTSWLYAIETATKPSGTGINYQYSINSGVSYSGSWLTIGELESAIQSIENPNKLRLKFQLSTTNVNNTPEVLNLNIISDAGYETFGYYWSGWYVHSDFVVFRTITFSVDIPDNTECEISIQLSDDTVDPLSDWQEVTNNQLIDQVADRFRFKVIFRTNGEETPVFSWLEITYWVNVVHQV